MGICGERNGYLGQRKIPIGSFYDRKHYPGPRWSLGTATANGQGRQRVLTQRVCMVLQSVDVVFISR